MLFHVIVFVVSGKHVFDSRRSVLQQHWRGRCSLPCEVFRGKRVHFSYRESLTISRLLLQPIQLFMFVCLSVCTVCLCVSVRVYLCMYVCMYVCMSPAGRPGFLVRVLPPVWNLRAFSLIPLFYGPLLFFCLVLLLLCHPFSAIGPFTCPLFL